VTRDLSRANPAQNPETNARTGTDVSPVTALSARGRFQGATGTFTKRATGILALPGLVQVWEGTAEIILDKK